ncbi:DUF664 domain-containing protein [Kitasatospora sp. NPDC059722]|uniref:mycothiol transferase n=1 Tax=unclassified Kitasatospora TaxID=2633591 RepID=UPI0036AD5B40
MTSADLLVDAFGRIREEVAGVVDGLSPEQLAFRVRDPANSIAWLVWHLTRIQDDHVADAADREQAWTADGWAERFALPFAAAATGYGHRPAQVAEVTATAELLLGYHEAVHARTVDFVRRLNGPSLARVVDESWDPPVTLGVRLVSVISDDLQHVGQAAYVRGLLGGG